MAQPNGKPSKSVKSTVNIPGAMSARAKLLAARQKISLQQLLVYGLSLALKTPPAAR